jgi:hypothetical protein
MSCSGWWSRRSARHARPGTGSRGSCWSSGKPTLRSGLKDDLTLVKAGELLERSGTVVPYRTLARFAAQECGYSPGGRKVTVPADDGEPGRELQVDFGYLGMIADGDWRRRMHALVFTAVFSRYCYVYLTFRQTTEAVIAGCEAAWESTGACSLSLSRTTSSRWFRRPAGWSRGGTGSGWSTRRPAGSPRTRRGSARRPDLLRHPLIPRHRQPPRHRLARRPYPRRPRAPLDPCHRIAGALQHHGHPAGTREYARADTPAPR